MLQPLGQHREAHLPLPRFRRHASVRMAACQLFQAAKALIVNAQAWVNFSIYPMAACCYPLYGGVQEGMSVLGTIYAGWGA